MQHIRYWHLLHWLSRPRPSRSRPHLPTIRVLDAHKAGGVTEADVLYQLAGPDNFARNSSHNSAEVGVVFSYSIARYSDLYRISSRKPDALVERYPVLGILLPRLRARILEVELARGEMPSAATPLALALSYAGGAEVFVSIVATIAPTDLVRGYTAGSGSRPAVFSHLLQRTFPGEVDSYESFAQRCAAARVEARSLVAAAVYAPQWAGHVEHYLGWPYLEEAIWWTHAHTKDNNWSVDAEVRAAWQAEMGERTPLGAADLVDGAVDVEWFWRAYHGLGAERWESVYAAATYASSGTGHARARLFADAMTGRIGTDALRERISVRRHQDSVRALGLVPLPEGSSAATLTSELIARYNVIQELARSSRAFGSQRRASEQLAARVALDNLARTAGFADPIRLQWAMEARVAADLRDPPSRVAEGDTCVALSVSAMTGMPALAVTGPGGRARSNRYRRA